MLYLLFVTLFVIFIICNTFDVLSSITISSITISELEIGTNKAKTKKSVFSGPDGGNKFKGNYHHHHYHLHRPRHHHNHRSRHHRRRRRRICFQLTM